MYIATYTGNRYQNIGNVTLWYSSVYFASTYKELPFPRDPQAQPPHFLGVGQATYGYLQLVECIVSAYSMNAAHSPVCRISG